MSDQTRNQFVPAKAGTQCYKTKTRNWLPLGSRFRGNERSCGASVLNALVTLILVLCATAAHADDFYRGKTISLIIGSNTSGGYDTYGRLLARHMGKHIAGHPALVVQNMPGAGGLRSANHIYNVAAKD